MEATSSDLQDPATRLAQLRERADELRNLMIEKGTRVQVPEASLPSNENNVSDSSRDIDAIEKSGDMEVGTSSLSIDIYDQDSSESHLGDTLSDIHCEQGTDSEFAETGHVVGTEAGDFESMVEGVIFQMRALKDEDVLIKCLAWWRSFNTWQRKKQKSIGLATSFARWNILQSHFLLMHANTSIELSRKKQCACTFRRRRLLESVLLLWGPLRRLAEAERLGQADSHLRHAMKRWRFKLAFSDWQVKSARTKRISLHLAQRHTTILARGIRQLRVVSRWREKLRPGMQKLEVGRQQHVMQWGLDGLWLNLVGGEAGWRVLLKVNCLRYCEAWKSVLQCGAAERTFLLQAKAATAWRHCARRRRAAAQKVTEHRVRWDIISSHVIGTGFLKLWREWLGENGAREQALMELLEYHNLDERYGLQLRGECLEGWRRWAADELRGKTARADSLARRTGARFAWGRWRTGLALQRADRASRQRFESDVVERLRGASRRWLLERCWGGWGEDHAQQQAKLREALGLGAGVVQKEAWLWARYIFGRWRKERGLRVAAELSTWRDRRGVCEAWRAWRAETREAEEVYAEEWAEAERMERRGRLVRGMLGLQVEAAAEGERAERVLRQWGVGRVEECWRAWRGEAEAGRRERERNWGLAEREQRVWQACARRRMRGVWEVLARGGREGRARTFAEGLARMRGEQSVWRAVVGWRERVAWFGEWGLLLSYRCPKRVTEWAALRSKASRRWLRWGLRGMGEGRVRGKRQRLCAENMRHFAIRCQLRAAWRAWGGVVESRAVSAGSSGGGGEKEEAASKDGEERSARAAVLEADGLFLSGFKVHVTGNAGPAANLKPVVRSLSMGGGAACGEASDGERAEERAVEVEEVVEEDEEEVAEAPRLQNAQPAPHPPPLWDAVLAGLSRTGRGEGEENAARAPLAAFTGEHAQSPVHPGVESAQSGATAVVGHAQTRQDASSRQPLDSASLNIQAGSQPGAPTSVRAAWEAMTAEEQAGAYAQRQRAMLEQAKAVLEGDSEPTARATAECTPRCPEITPRDQPEINPKCPEITPKCPAITPRAPEITPLRSEKSMPGSAVSQASTVCRREVSREDSEGGHVAVTGVPGVGLKALAHGAAAGRRSRDDDKVREPPREKIERAARKEAARGHVDGLRRSGGGRGVELGGSEMKTVGGRRAVRGGAAGAVGRAQSRGKAKKFYVHASNGWQLVSDHLSSLGWDRIRFADTQASYALKWVGSPVEVDYGAFEDGQLVNQIKGISALTNKAKLVTTLARVVKHVNPFSRRHLHDFFPRTLTLDVFVDLPEAEAEALGPLIVKPANRSKGRGVFIAADRSQVLATLGTQAVRKSGSGTERTEHPEGPRRSQPTQGSKSARASVEEKAPTRRSSLGAANLTRSSSLSNTKASSANRPSTSSATSARASAHQQPAARPASSLGTSSRAQASTRVSGAAAASVLHADAARSDQTDTFVVQKYVVDPLLLDGCKFDMRVYLLVARVEPLLAFYHDGYLRVAMEPYASTHLDNRFANITNIAVQKEHPAFLHTRERKVWSFDQLRAHLHAQRTEETCAVCGLPLTSSDGDVDAGSEAVHEADAAECRCDAVESHIKPQIKGCLRAALLSAYKEMDTRRGMFSLLGADLLVDSSLNVHLLELNKNPDLELHTRQLEQLLPGVVKEALDIVLEAHEGAGTGTPRCVEGFEHLYDESDDQGLATDTPGR